MTAGKPQGLPKSGGRTKGVPNKASKKLRALALKYTERAMKEVGRLSTEAASEEVRLKAAQILFERAAGKVPQPVDGDGEGGPIQLNLSALTDDELAELARLRSKLATDGGVAGGAGEEGSTEGA